MPARKLEASAARSIVGASLALSMNDQRLVHLERQQRSAASDALIAEMDRLRSEYAKLIASAEATVDSPHVEATTAAEAALKAAQEATIGRLREDCDLYLDLATDWEREAEDARLRASTAERERDYLRSQLGEIRSGRNERPTRGKDLTDQVGAEIKGRGEVAGARPRNFAIGQFLEITLESHGERYRSKLVRACADVAINAPGLLGRRDDHQLRLGDGGNSPTRRRSWDDAVAHRCYLEHKTPSARRLHYWVLPDGSVEFASVNLHDDMNIPE